MPTYSKTPLAKKLGIKTGNCVYLHDAPLDYFSLLEMSESDVQLESNPQANSLDFIHVFVTDRVVLEAVVISCKSWLKKTGMMWISWPKGSSKIPTDLKRDPIREYVLGVGLVDVKVASFDDDWSGLKFVWRLKDR